MDSLEVLMIGWGLAFVTVGCGIIWRNIEKEAKK